VLIVRCVLPPLIRERVCGKIAIGLLALVPSCFYVGHDGNRPDVLQSESALVHQPTSCAAAHVRHRAIAVADGGVKNSMKRRLAWVAVVSHQPEGSVPLGSGAALLLTLRAQNPNARYKSSDTRLEAGHGAFPKRPSRRNE
jgi:hypothetical protein